MNSTGKIIWFTLVILVFYGNLINRVALASNLDIVDVRILPHSIICVESIY